MSKMFLDPLVLLAILVGLVLWGLSLIARVPGSWLTGWAVATALAAARAILTHGHHRG